MEIEVDTPNVVDTKQEKIHQKGETNQINTGSGTHSETFREEVFETPR